MTNDVHFDHITPTLQVCDVAGIAMPAVSTAPASAAATSIKHWPHAERPREKLLARGSAALSDAELLALFLGSGLRGKNAVELARDLLTHHDGLRGLMAMTPAALMRIRGLGAARATRLCAALELATRHLAAGLHREGALTDTKRIRDYFRMRLRDRPREVFACLFLDTRSRPIAVEELFTGTINHAQVHPREVLRRCIELNASAVVVAHNHPSGDAEPSQDDKIITRHLREVLGMADVVLIDHLVVGDNTVTSFVERGWL